MSDEHAIIDRLRASVKQARDGVEVSHALDAKDRTQHPIKAGDLGVLKSVTATPYREHPLYDQLLGPITAITTRLRQVRL